MIPARVATLARPPSPVKTRRQGRPRATAVHEAPPHRRRPLHHRAARHVGRDAHHVLRWFGSFAAVLILFALVGIWRVMQGPIELDWLAPYVEAAFERSGSGLKVAISGVRFGIDRTTHQLDLRAENVHVVAARRRAAWRVFPKWRRALGLAHCSAAG